MKAKFSTWVSFLVIIIILFLLWACHGRQNKISAERVILIGIDGVGSLDLQMAVTPNLDSMIRRGALSLTTRAVMPTVSGPNWSSHLLGAGPEQHGITCNGWTVGNHTVEATITDDDGYFPSVFKLLKEQLPGHKTALFYDWDALLNYYNPVFIDKIEYSKGFMKTFKKATPWIIENDPHFTFIYIGEPDEMGHAYQWHSNEYIESIEKVDEALGNFFQTLRENNMFENTHFIVVTDHGGVGYGHGGLSMDEIEIPWIISGPGIIQDRIIEQPNDVYNTASTIAYLFDLEQPIAWVGTPVYGAFVSEKKYSLENNASYLPRPFFSISSGLYDEPQLVDLNISDPSVDIRFETNGTNPTHKSNLYQSPVYLQRSMKLNAGGFSEGKRSQISELDYRLVIGIEEIDLSVQPSEKYEGDGAQTLSDKRFGSVDFKNGGWLGFEGTDLIADIRFAKYQDIQRVSLGCLNLAGSWIFLPTQLTVYASVDGKKFVEAGRIEAADIKAQSVVGRNEIEIPIAPLKARFLRIVGKNEGVCPKGHPGEGQKAWLFVDEIILENN